MRYWRRTGPRTRLCNDVRVTDDLTRLDPESERCVPEMVEVISAELAARVSVGDFDVHDPAWVARISTLSADALLDRFELRPRSEATPRYRRD